MRHPGRSCPAQLQEAPSPPTRTRPRPPLIAPTAPALACADRKSEKQLHTLFRNTPLPEHPPSGTPLFRNTPLPEHPPSGTPPFRNTPLPEYPSSGTPPFRNLACFVSNILQFHQFSYTGHDFAHLCLKRLPFSFRGLVLYQHGGEHGSHGAGEVVESYILIHRKKE
ncbi:hypothetical protein STEG23_032660 [Scotinomys teguina]